MLNLSALSPGFKIYIKDGTLAAAAAGATGTAVQSVWGTLPLSGLAFTLFFCNINTGGNMKVSRTVKSKICIATKVQQLQQHLSAKPMMTHCCGHCQNSLSQRCHSLVLCTLGELHPPRLQEQSAGDKPDICRSTNRSSRAAEM